MLLPAQAVPGVGASAAKAFILELCWAVLREQLDAPDLAVGLAGVELDLPEASSILADVIWLASLETELAPDLRTRLVDLAKSLVAPTGEPTSTHPLTRALLLAHCEGEFLEECGLIPSAAGWKKKEVRVNTRLVYTQQKFNLLREESEGYAKLITELAALGDRDSTPEAIASATRSIQSLIGYFDLDPNRALDLALDAAERKPEHAGLRRLLDLFRRESVPQILGFKFQNHAKAMEEATARLAARGADPGAETDAGSAEAEDGEAGRDVDMPDADAEEGEAGAIVSDADADGTTSEVGTHADGVDTPRALNASERAALQGTPESLYLLAATLIREKAVALDEIYAHLSPPDDVAAERRAASVATRMDAVRRIGVVNLLARSSDAKGTAPDAATVASTPPDDVSDQKLGLLRGLLAAGDVDSAAAMIERMSNLGLDPAEDPTVRAALCASLADAVREHHARGAPAGCAAAARGRGDEGGASDPGEDGERLPDEAFRRLFLLGPYVCHDVALHARVVRCVGRHLAWARAAGDADATRVGERAAGEALIPALGLIPANPGASNELWDVLSRMPTTTRFRLYAEWKATHVESDGGFGIGGGRARRRCVPRSRRLAPSRCPTRERSCAG